MKKTILNVILFIGLFGHGIVALAGDLDCNNGHLSATTIYSLENTFGSPSSKEKGQKLVLHSGEKYNFNFSCSYFFFKTAFTLEISSRGKTIYKQGELQEIQKLFYPERQGSWNHFLTACPLTDPLGQEILKRLESALQLAANTLIQTVTLDLSVDLKSNDPQDWKWIFLGSN